VTRVLIVGLDCAPPALLFDRLAADLPVLTGLRRRGAHGPLRSVMPPITVPAWACMTTGRDPGELGLYGFRKRAGEGPELTMADGRDLEGVPHLWDLAGAAGRRVAALHVPGTFPPREVVGGVLVSGMLSRPGAPFTHPRALGDDLEARFGPHRPDVDRFDDPAAVLDELYASTAQHFAMSRAVLAEEGPFDLAMSVELGTDRLHHTHWRHLDPSHPAHDPEAPEVRDAKDYYAFVDAEVGRLVEAFGVDDDPAVLVVSDHGARTLRGAFRLNEWLRRRGWLVLREAPTRRGPLDLDAVDWDRTRAYGFGGYYGRIWLHGDGDRPALVRELAEAGVVAHAPEDLYGAVRGRAPDLLTVVDDLDRRFLGSVGPGPIDAPGDDRGGVDECNHDWDGVFILAGATARGPLTGLSLFDVGATALALLGVDAPWPRGRDRSRG
jgi:predicted AlkP superfamily phosphohydrolase/phosphomutase